MVEDKDDRKYLWVAYTFMITLILMSTWSWYINKNNTYMEYRDVPVTFVDRWSSESCYKGSCRDRWHGLFKTDDGVYFDRPISLYMYRQMRLGEHFDLNIRQMDIKQTTRDNALWFFLPVIVWVITAVLWIIAFVSLGECIWDHIKSKHKG